MQFHFLIFIRKFENADDCSHQIDWKLHCTVVYIIIFLNATTLMSWNSSVKSMQSNWTILNSRCDYINPFL